MNGAFKRIDLSAYPRRAQFEYFSRMANPYVGVTAQVDITALYGLIKTRGLPFFLTLLYALDNAANAVPEFRQRVTKDFGILEFDHCLSSLPSRWRMAHIATVRRIAAFRLTAILKIRARRRLRRRAPPR